MKLKNDEELEGVIKALEERAETLEPCIYVAREHKELGPEGIDQFNLVVNSDGALHLAITALKTLSRGGMYPSLKKEALYSNVLRLETDETIKESFRKLIEEDHA